MSSKENRFWERVFLKNDPDDPEYNEKAFRRMMEGALNDLDPDAKGETGCGGVKTEKAFRPNTKMIRTLQDTSPSIDLHGLTREQAHQKTAAFIRNQRQDGCRWVAVIVGKGHHSDSGRAVLRDVTERLLTDLKKIGEIVDWYWDRKDKEKSGSVLVRTRV